jgi:hypothetical protein
MCNRLGHTQEVGNLIDLAQGIPLELSDVEVKVGRYVTNVESGVVNEESCEHRVCVGIISCVVCCQRADI